MRLVCDSGRTNALVCPFHAWTYRLDGSLRHIPHSEGFPDVDVREYGLTSLRVEESAGVVFVGDAGAGAYTQAQ